MSLTWPATAAPVVAAAGARTVGAYRAFGSEVDVGGALTAAQAAGLATAQR